MKTNFNFKSAVCTSRKQSERLLALGLKKETADMVHHYMYSTDDYELKDIEFSRIMHLQELVNKKPVLGRSGDDLYAKDIPAWSLGRLIEMLPSPIKLKDDLPTFHPYAFLGLSQVSVNYHWRDYDEEERNLVGFYGNGFFAAVVDAIEWLIKEGYFPKEYLEE